MALTLWKPVDSFRGEPFLPNAEPDTYRIYVKKYGDEQSMEILASRIDEILIRYAEVLLTYAEATYELNDQISDADLDISINTLRNRFANDPDKLPALTNTFVKRTWFGYAGRNSRERRVELVSESLRYDDLIRWKTAETELPQEILGAKFDKSAYRIWFRVKISISMPTVLLLYNQAVPECLIPAKTIYFHYLYGKYH